MLNNNEKIDEGKPGLQFVYYGYVGLLIGFYLYFFVFAGNWDYYFSGAWTREQANWETLFRPGFYINNKIIPIPEILAVPLFLAGCTFASYFVLLKLEDLVHKFYQRKKGETVDRLHARHTVFTLCTTFSWYYFFIFAGRPMLNRLPEPLIQLFNIVVIVAGGLWFFRSIKRTKKQYEDEALEQQLKRQLDKVPLEEFLGSGVSINDLKRDGLVVLDRVRRVLKEKGRLLFYKGLLEEKLQKGTLIESLEYLYVELGLTEQEHEDVLNTLKQEQPHLFPSSQPIGQETVLNNQKTRLNRTKLNPTKTVLRSKDRKNY